MIFLRSTEDENVVMDEVVTTTIDLDRTMGPRHEVETVGIEQTEGCPGRAISDRPVGVISIQSKDHDVSSIKDGAQDLPQGTKTTGTVEYRDCHLQVSVVSEKGLGDVEEVVDVGSSSTQGQTVGQTDPVNQFLDKVREQILRKAGREVREQETDRVDDRVETTQTIEVTLL